MLRNLGRGPRHEAWLQESSRKKPPQKCCSVEIPSRLHEFEVDVFLAYVNPAFILGSAPMGIEPPGHYQSNCKVEPVSLQHLCFFSSFAATNPGVSVHNLNQSQRMRLQRQFHFPIFEWLFLGRRHRRSFLQCLDLLPGRESRASHFFVCW
jgi:hypothetical protein